MDIVQRQSPPSGTVVFLFTDIEGSTARWEAHQSAMRGALTRHDALLSRAIAAHGGYVFKTVGDAFCAVFPQAPDAIDAAIDVQRALLAADWSDVGGLRVRAALHAGEAHERDGDYFGPNVNRVSRLLSTGHGGQVLLSSTVAALLSGCVPAGATLVDLGVHRLKDLTEPEHVFQLCVPDVPSAFGPLNSLDAFAHNLPRQATSFVGRDEDLAHVKSMMEQSPLVSIVGTGGVGKTRVALQIAADVLDSRRSAWFVNLAPVGDPALIAGTILSALGVPEQAGVPAGDALMATLRDRNALIVLDNCEHLIARVAPLASQIVQQCRRVAILATSREALNVAGERVYRLPTLDLDSAVTLFVDRARAADSTFVLRDSDQTVVEDICRRVDCIALAVELSASRVRVLPPRALAAKLDERFRILTGGSRSALPRQQTLQTLIDWSFDLLTEREQMLFRRLSIFRGGFDIEAVAGVCALGAMDEWESFELLSALVDKSLVNADRSADEPRYDMLSSIQEYAGEKLQAADERAALAAAHAAFFARRATNAYEEWDREPRAGWLRIFAVDLDNFRAALTWSFGNAASTGAGATIAANVMPLFLRRSLLREGTSWCERALDATPQNDALRARLFYGLSMLYNNEASLKKALACAERAVNLYRDCGDVRGLTRALSQVAQQSARQGRSCDALPYAEEALDLARQAADRRLLAGTLQRCAMAYECDDVDRARALFQESVELFRTLGRPGELSRALMWWADAEALAGCTERAVELSLEALEHEPGDAEVYVRVNVAAFYAASGNLARSAEAARLGLATAIATGHSVLEAAAMAYLAAAHRGQDYADALLLFGYARMRFQALDYTPEPETRESHERFLRAAGDAHDDVAVARALNDGAALSEAAARELAGRL